MKKIILIAAALIGLMAFNGCDGLTEDEANTLTERFQGDKGDQGLSAYEVAVENGFSGTEAEWIESLRGDAGIDGIDGLDGLSAYQLWVLAGNEGTLDDFFAALKGEKGDKGDQGEKGDKGDTVVVGECPVCETCPEPITLPVITYDGNATMGIHTTAQDWVNIKVGHLLNNAIVEYDDAITENEDGVLSIDKKFDVGTSGTHIIGIQFDN